MAIEYMTFEDVLAELQIDEEELKKLVSQGELRGFRDGLSMKFKKDDVLNLKQGRETEPTIILTDSDQEMGIAESSDELILEDSTSDTVINIGDIMAPGKGKGGAGSAINMAGDAATSDQQEIIFDTSGDETGGPAMGSDSGADPEAAIPTVEVPSVSEDMGLVETDSDAQLVEVGSDESMETEAFELMDESGEADGGVAVAPVKGGRASRRTAGQTGRLRALAIEQKRPHAAMTAVLLLGMMLMSLNGGVLMNEVLGISPEWLDGWTGTFRGITEGVFGIFNG